MHILIAPDSFKESLSARLVAEALHRGLAHELPEATFDLLPLADGGEGTVDALLAAIDGEMLTANVAGPLGTEIQAKYGLINSGNTAVIEMAEVCGLGLLPVKQRDPKKTTSYGCGELIMQALDQGVTEVIFGIGGSATVDGGLGMCQALGVSFFDENNNAITQYISGELLGAIAKVDIATIDPRLHNLKLLVASDVTNPLLGPTGASYVFGPQKGGDPTTVAMLEEGMAHVYTVIENQLRQQVRDLPGAGAAGGMGAALMAFFNASIRSGIDVIGEAGHLEQRVSTADLVITGEGCLDRQTVYGKTPMGVLRVAERFKVPVVAVGGMLGEGASDLLSHGFAAIEAAVVRPQIREEALNAAQANLQFAGRRIACWLKLAKQIGT